jgi:hypothetical protein
MTGTIKTPSSAHLPRNDTMSWGMFYSVMCGRILRALDEARRIALYRGTRMIELSSSEKHNEVCDVFVMFYELHETVL